MEMFATVIQVNSNNLLVRDLATGEEIRVNFRDARRFSAGDNIRITFSGAMTHSLPPQISAISIHLMSGQQPPAASSHSEIRGIIIHRGRNYLRIRDSRNRQITVRYRYSYHFCVGQHVRVRFETMFINNQTTVNATDIIPIC